MLNTVHCSVITVITYVSSVLPVYGAYCESLIEPFVDASPRTLATSSAALVGASTSALVTSSAATFVGASKPVLADSFTAPLVRASTLALVASSDAPFVGVSTLVLLPQTLHRSLAQLRRLLSSVVASIRCTVHFCIHIGARCVILWPFSTSAFAALPFVGALKNVARRTCYTHYNNIQLKHSSST